MDALGALKRYFGHSAFRPGQDTLIAGLLEGRDVLGVMPTGAGKSICYQIPALLLEGVTVVISPLISLMKDQVAALVQAGIPAAYINSSLSFAQYQTVFQRAEEGRYKILYIAPERLATDDFLRLADRVPISLVAVDEAHCVSQWGQDFRPSYLKITEFLDQLPSRPRVGAFTATATDQVKADIVRLLKLREPLSLTTGFDRPNLSFAVTKPKSKSAYLRDFVLQRPGKTGIVYCATRKSVEAVCDELRGYGIQSTRYHAGLPDWERQDNQEDFVYDRAKVMVATNAFGMGIDKSNVNFVVHYNMPKNLESYYQEAGRAGRDGEPAECVLLFSNGDVQTAKFLIQNSNDNEELTAEERERVLQRDLDRLEQMVGYCRTELCLRAYLLRYFGEEHSGNCGNCSNCVGEFSLEDITEDSQKILSCVARVNKRFPGGLGTTILLRMLHGSREQRVLQLGLDRIPTYGILSNIPRTRIREYIDFLISQEYLTQSTGEYPVLGLGSRSGDVLFRGARVQRKVRKESRPLERAQTEGVLEVALPGGEGLLSALKSLRNKLAQTENVPAYVIFSNATLTDMALRRPQTTEEFLEVSGVGQVKAARYGQDFLALLQAYAQGELSPPGEMGDSSNSDMDQGGNSSVRSGAKWTAEEERVIAAQYEEGLSVTEIARKQRRSPGGIYARLVKLGCIEEDS